MSMLKTSSLRSPTHCISSLLSPITISSPNPFFFLQEQIHSDLENLKKQKEELLELKRSGERRCQDLLVRSCCLQAGKTEVFLGSTLLIFHNLQTRTEAERQKIVSEFRQLRHFLKEKEMVLVARLGELDRAVLRRQEEEEAKVEGDISLLGILICEMEEKLKQPTRGFLQVRFLRVGFLWVGYSIGPSPFLSTFSKAGGD